MAIYHVYSNPPKNVWIKTERAWGTNIWLSLYFIIFTINKKTVPLTRILEALNKKEINTLQLFHLIYNILLNKPSKQANHHHHDSSYIILGRYILQRCKTLCVNMFFLDSWGISTNTNEIILLKRLSIIITTKIKIWIKWLRYIECDE